jgi:hypothetical protein
MPTNLLVWNIQNFTSNKFMPGGELVPVRDINGRFVAAVDYNNIRKNYILNNIARSNAHVVVVIETISGRGVKGSLIQSAGSVGARSLLAQIRTATNNANWWLVPPLKLVDALQVQEIEDDDSGELNFMIQAEGAYTEGISVFYNSQQLTFNGPYYWPASTRPNTLPNDNPQKVAVALAGPTENYPAPWNNVLPAGNHRAGQYQYFDNNQAEILFPAVGSRRPFFTQFVEAGTGRIISLVSVHFPPNGASAGAALTSLSGYFRHHYAISPNEVILIAGDYNIDYLTDGIYLRHLDEDRFVPLLTGARTRMPTMYKRRGNATATDYLKPAGLDNIAVRYGSLGAVNPTTLQILNRVGPAQNFEGLTYIPLEEILKLPDPAQTDCFRSPQNYGYLGPAPGTSDHMGLALNF